MADPSAHIPCIAKTAVLSYFPSDRTFRCSVCGGNMIIGVNDAGHRGNRKRGLKINRSLRCTALRLICFIINDGLSFRVPFSRRHKREKNTQNANKWSKESLGLGFFFSPSLNLLHVYSLNALRNESASALCNAAWLIDPPCHFKEHTHTHTLDHLHSLYAPTLKFSLRSKEQVRHSRPLNPRSHQDQADSISQAL